MKKILLIVLAMIPSTCLADPAIVFKVENHDFGIVMLGEKLEYDFVFINAGSDDLIVSQVTSFT